MRIPDRPPRIESLWSQIAAKPEGAERLTSLLSSTEGPLIDGEYLHWDKLRHRNPPDGLSSEEWWAVIKLRRRVLFKNTSLADTYGKPFRYVTLDSMTQLLHEIDLGAGGMIQIPEPITNPNTRDRYCVSSLMEEAITSSQIEGATTTRDVAKEMLRSGRPPRDESERMILNNYRAIQRMGAIKNQPLTKEIVFELHEIMTEGTLKNPSAAGRFRNDSEHERISVMDESNDQVLHSPPPAADLPVRMDRMCDFANNTSASGFIHPVIRSILLHFWLAYDHPFVDGNGRTARALFYWSMLHNGYWLSEFLSISAVIRKAPVKYGLAFLCSETDDNDLTYFVLYHLDVIRRALGELHEYIQRKTAEVKKIEQRLRGLEFLNQRQQALISHAIRHPDHVYTIESHKVSHNVVYQTARQDLLDLRNRGLLKARKAGKLWRFTPLPDLQDRLSNWNPMDEA